jgi:hypothetical protein
MVTSPNFIYIVLLYSKLHGLVAMVTSAKDDCWARLNLIVHCFNKSSNNNAELKLGMLYIYAHIHIPVLNEFSWLSVEISGTNIVFVCSSCDWRQFLKILDISPY